MNAKTELDVVLETVPMCDSCHCGLVVLHSDPASGHVLALGCPVCGGAFAVRCEMPRINN